MDEKGQDVPENVTYAIFRQPEWVWHVFGHYFPHGVPFSPLAVTVWTRPPWWKRQLMRFFIGSTWERIS